MTRQCMDTQGSTELYNYWKGTIGVQDFKKGLQTMSRNVQNASATKSTLNQLEQH